jgi:hypothetical protein
MKKKIRKDKLLQQAQNITEGLNEVEYIDPLVMKKNILLDELQEMTRKAIKFAEDNADKYPELHQAMQKALHSDDDKKLNKKKKKKIRK